ncbi:unnamed protein product [Angiostrongylus costaricensis]|uniref:Tumor protein p53-inducible protein 11 n=1 Tax=Angiostrongylus costaricensis TaxID=334426 RepID=A0A0R3PM27_ANGCS|nr:unnamed protein product [Angiostrongylus costaricensis]
MIDEQTVVNRKQSASDLQSRLKTRKLLGVGELARDNGDIYKSKISQLLGINENLYVRLPRGLLYWNTLTALYLYMFGIMVTLRLDYGLEVKSDESTFIARIYGACLISFGILFRSTCLELSFLRRLYPFYVSLITNLQAMFVRLSCHKTNEA